MWLLPLFPHVSKLIASTFYRLAISGGRVPREGPVLLVANHPNSLMDPALVAAVAGRPVRFLAKAPLFTDPAVGFLVRRHPASTASHQPPVLRPTCRARPAAG